MNISIQIAAKIDAMHKPAGCKLIMVEGPDGTGKSSIIKLLAQCPAYKLAPGADNGKQEQRNDDKQWQAEVLIPEAKAFDGITLLYRSWLSDIVYPQIRGRLFDASRVNFLMEELFCELNAMLVLLHPSKQLLDLGYQEYSASQYQRLTRLFELHYHAWPNTVVTSLD